MAAARPARALTERLDGLGRPSDRSAVIVRATLPASLERLRRGSVMYASAGLPAHLTMLYPFVTPERLTSSVRSTLQAVAVRHEPFPYAQVGRAIWPDALYVAVDPIEPFVALQTEVAAVFPAFPIYGADTPFDFVPHITIAERAAVGDQATLHSRAWASLPLRARASALEVIARVGGERWQTVWRISLGGQARAARR